MFKFLPLFIFVLLLITYYPLSVSAQTSQLNLSISPAFVNVSTDPGVPVSSQLKIRNESNTQEFLKISLAKFSASKEGNKPKLEIVNKDDEFIKWISFSESQFVLGSGEQKTIKFTVSPPGDAALGYYYAVIIKRVTEKAPDLGETVLSGAPTFLIVLEVRSPDARKELALLDFKTSSSWYEYLPATFNIKFKNTGNVHLIPSGDIFIDWEGQKDIGIVPVNANRGNILQGTVRTYNASWDDNGNAVYETKVDWSRLTKFRIGKYTAHLLAVYDNGQKDIPIEATISFWVIPWKAILAILVFLLIILKFLVIN